DVPVVVVRIDADDAVHDRDRDGKGIDDSHRAGYVGGAEGGRVGLMQQERSVAADQAHAVGNEEETTLLGDAARPHVEDQDAVAHVDVLADDQPGTGDVPVIVVRIDADDAVHGRDRDGKGIDDSHRAGYVG